LRKELRNHVKIRIFGRDQGEAETQTAGILKYVEDLSRGLNADIGRKDFFEMASSDKPQRRLLEPARVLQDLWDRFQP
jgi:hypothetical protein